MESCWLVFQTAQRSACPGSPQRGLPSLSQRVQHGGGALQAVLLLPCPS